MNASFFSLSIIGLLDGNQTTMNSVSKYDCKHVSFATSSFNQNSTYHSPYQAHSRHSDLLWCLSTHASDEAATTFAEDNPSTTRTDSLRNRMGVIIVVVFLLVLMSQLSVGYCYCKRTKSLLGYLPKCFGQQRIQADAVHCSVLYCAFGSTL